VHASAARVVTYGLSDVCADWRARDIIYGETSSFTLTNGIDESTHDIARITTTLLGAHNIQNIVGAAAYLLTRELVTIQELITGIKTFTGIARRLDKKTLVSRVPCYEGFGSSDAKARSAINAIKLHFKERRLVVVFEPHTFSWRNRNMITWYDTTFTGVDELLVYHPATQGATTHEQLTHDEIIARLQSAGISTHKIETPESCLTTLKEITRPTDVVLILSSGAMDGLTEAIPHALDTWFS
jgi:UDP-N-acetylmuramate: L-alanyl-gamma-D-glutamyl-meso-diaminopimelate ligase